MPDNSPKPWDRRDDETARAHEVFLLYRDLGADRTLDALCEALDRPATYRRQLSRWVQRHDWERRVAAWDSHVLSMRDSVQLDAVVEAQQYLRDNLHRLSRRLVDVAVGNRGTDAEGKPLPPPTGAEVRALLGAIDRAGITVVTRVDHTSKGDAIGQPLNPAALSDAALAEVAAQLGIDEDEEGETP